jgi:AAA+ superfamily predicted ATPase
MDMMMLIGKFILAVLQNRPKPVYHYIKRHFGADPRGYSVVKTEYEKHRAPCLFLAIQKFIETDCCSTKSIGVNTDDPSGGLAYLIHPDQPLEQTEGPIEYGEVTRADGQTLSFVKRAIYFLRYKGHALAVLLTQGEYSETPTVEVMARQRQISEEFSATLRNLANENSIYKGQVLTMSLIDHEMEVHFHKVPAIERQQVILPEAIMTEVERHTLRFSQHKKLLRARGRHLKRGLLLYGPPGTGKSLITMYLIAKMPQRTTILVRGNAVQHFEDACEFARALQPATIIIDDVDLVAEQRTSRRDNSLLFEMLNQMDGIAEDADILFLLTTNRPEILEPAISSRPGRIDQAIMVPLPDRSCRLRLFDLYAQNLPHAIKDTNKLIARTEGASGALIREMFRKATLLALEEGPDVSVSDKHLERALDALTKSNPMGGKLIGFSTSDEGDERGWFLNMRRNRGWRRR